jgi:two-component system sensor histidine kinase YesM
MIDKRSEYRKGKESMSQCKKKRTFDKKMIRFISVALISSMIIIVIISAVSTVTSLTRKSKQMALKEVEVMTANTEEYFKRYHEVSWAITLDGHIQNYLRAPSGKNEFVANANSVLDNVCNMWGNINFVTVIRSDEEGSLTKGNSIPNWKMNYEKKIMEDYKNSLLMKSNGMRMVFSNEYSTKGNYSLSIFYPMYSTTVIGMRLGTLCINVDDTNLNQLMNGYQNTREFAVDTFFVHENGQIVAAADQNNIGGSLKGVDLEHETTVTTSSEKMIIYKKLNNWNFYFVTQIHWWELLKDSLKTVVFLCALLGGLMIIIIKSARKMVSTSYEPWGNIVQVMELVSDGDIEIRLEDSESDPDMYVVSKGFNSMMDQIVKLMDQVKKEQYQMDYIRMEALQSQIQPHFLYNTLDCIHWQAVIDGNQDISNMVKALASYYRICLSKGRDVIQIKEECEYIKNYLYIQKIRYGDILSYEIEMDQVLENSLIPKLTLQPLVENCIYHGIKALNEKAGFIKVTISEEKGRIRIQVRDNGIGMKQEEVDRMNQMITVYDEEFGYGVRNVNRRIQLMFGMEYGLKYKKNQDMGITAEIILPDTKKVERMVFCNEGIDCR